MSDGLMGDLPGSGHVGSGVKAVPSLEADTTHFPSQRVLGSQDSLIGLKCIFYFSSPLCKYLGFLPKYLGRIVYFWLLSPPMAHCNLAVAAHPVPSMEERPAPKSRREAQSSPSLSLSGRVLVSESLCRE